MAKALVRVSSSMSFFSSKTCPSRLLVDLAVLMAVNDGLLVHHAGLEEDFTQMFATTGHRVLKLIRLPTLGLGLIIIARSQGQVKAPASDAAYSGPSGPPAAV